MVKEQVIEKESKTLNLKSLEKVLLHRSIAQYLERSGFTKCFKKLLSEAEIEKKELDCTLPDLEEIYFDFLKKRDEETVEVKDAEDGKKKAENVDENASDDRKKDKKKKTKEAAVNGIAEANAVEGAEKVKKKEAKLVVTEEEKVKEADVEIADGPKDKKKKKKKKSKSVEAESLGDDEEEKVSKKRKRSEPEEEKEPTTGDDEESKRRKKEENVGEDDGSVLETPVKQTEVEESETKSTNQKSGKGFSNSKEPKKPFQRVNIEEVVFTDDRLKDNSYWAKDGADSGYGAKAQEVLGQVRGRDFRHEKTKKKRGSYRGGEIDLQSHSVKFDYSDEE